MTLQFIKQQLCSTVPPFDVTMQIKIEPIGSTSCRELTNMMEESRQENFDFADEMKGKLSVVCLLL